MLEEKLLRQLKAALAQTELDLTEGQYQQLIDLVMLVNKWNKAYNLTSVRDPASYAFQVLLEDSSVHGLRHSIRQILACTDFLYSNCTAIHMPLDP